MASVYWQQYISGTTYKTVSSISLSAGGSQKMRIYMDASYSSSQVTITPSSSDITVTRGSVSGSSYPITINASSGASGTYTVVAKTPKASATLTVKVSGGSTSTPSISGPSSITINSLPAKYTASGFSNPDQIEWDLNGSAEGYAEGNIFTITSITNKTGTITLTATYGSQSATKSISTTKVDIPVTSFTPSKTSVSLYTGSYTTVTYTYSPSDANVGTTPSVSGASHCTVSVSSGSIRITGSSAGTDTLTFSNSYGASFTIKVTVSDPPPESVEVTSMTVSTSSLSIMEGETGRFTVKVSPSTADDLTIRITCSDANYSSYLSWSTSRSGATTTVTVRGLSYSSGRVRLAIYANGGSISAKYVDVYVTKAPVYVSSISLYANEETIKLSTSKSLTPTVSPTNADNRSVTWSIVSGGSYVSWSTSGNRISIQPLAVGTAKWKITADDGGGAYTYYTLHIVADTVLATSLIISNDLSIDSPISSMDVRVNKTAVFYAHIRPTNASDLTTSVSIIGGTGQVTVVKDSSDFRKYTITGVTEGVVNLRISANDASGLYKDLTVNVLKKINDDYPHDKTNLISLIASKEMEPETLCPDLYRDGATYKLHSGYNDGPLTIPGLVVSIGNTNYSSIPPSTSYISSNLTAMYLNGTPLEPGEWWIYTENSEGMVVGNRILVTGEGGYTKILRFDANAPSGKTVNGTVPSTITHRYTPAGSHQFEIPPSDLSVDGFVFIGWRTVTDNSSVNIYNAGDTITVNGTDTDTTLYAEWFPIPEGATGSGTVEDPFHWTVKPDGLSITVPNKGDYPVEYTSVFPDDMPDGVRVVANGVAYATINSISLQSGHLVIAGTPVMGVELFEFRQIGKRAYQVNFALTISAGAVPEEGQPLVYSLDANGGRFPDGSSVVSLTAADDSYILPDWSVVDRTGHILDGWMGTANGRADMGSRQFTLDTWTAIWKEDTRYVDPQYLPMPSVRIYRDIKDYISLDGMFVSGGMPQINLSENAADDATMTVILRYDVPSDNILSSKCNLWSQGGYGAIGTGMYVRFDDLDAEGRATYLMDGVISTITPDAENCRVSITVADLKSVMSKSGTTIRRNYYASRVSDALFDAIPSTNALYADVSSIGDSTVDGTPQWAVNTGNIEHSGSDVTVIGSATYEGSFPISVSYTFDASAQDMVRGMDVTLQIYSAAFTNATAKGYAQLTSSTGEETGRAEWAVSGSVTGRVDFPIALDFDRPVSGKGQVTLSLYVTGATSTQTVGLVFSVKTGSGTGVVRTYSSVLKDTDLAGTVRGFAWAPVTGYSIADGRMTVTGIEGVSIGSPPSEDLYMPYAGRLRMSYVSESVDTPRIMSGVCEAMGIIPLVNDTVMARSETALRVFRTGGGYALDYIQKLADVPSSDGRMRSFRIRGYTTPMMAVSTRHMTSESPRLAIAYGGDAVASSNVVCFHSFAPKITLKDRPSLAMVRASGKMSDGSTVPIMVAVEDTEAVRRRHGLSIETISADSSVSTPLGAAQSGYSVITANDLDQWEGTVVLPGIITNLIEQYGEYAGSGIPVSLYDSRIGLDGYRAKVKQVTLDYNACTTTVVLTNYSMRHSNSLSSTVAVAISAADYSTGMTDTTLYDTQYVYVKTDKAQTVYNTGNTLYVHKSNGSHFAVGELQILKYPDHSVVLATLPAESSNHTSSKYDIVGVSINTYSPDKVLKIPAPLRPDYYTGQILVVNIRIP